MSPLKKEESFALWFVGKFIVIISILGVATDFLVVNKLCNDITVSLYYGGGVKSVISSLPLGLLLLFIVLGLFGAWVDNFLHKTIRNIINDWARI